MELLPLLLLPVLMYFLLIRPQQKRMRETQAMLAALREGDEVVTVGGIYGFVHAIEGDVVWLEIADGVLVRISRRAVGQRLTPAVDVTADPDDTGSDATPGDGR